MTYRDDVVYVYEVTTVESGGRQRGDVDDIVEERAVSGLDLAPWDPEYIRGVRLTVALRVEMDNLENRKEWWMFRLIRTRPVCK